MVLDQGRIREFQSPQELLQDTESVFYGMAKDAGLVWESQSPQELLLNTDSTNIV